MSKQEEPSTAELIFRAYFHGVEGDSDEEPEEPPNKKPRRKPLARKRDVEEVYHSDDNGDDSKPSRVEQMEEEQKYKRYKQVTHAKERTTAVTDDEVKFGVMTLVSKMSAIFEEECDTAKAFDDAGVDAERNLPKQVTERMCKFMSILKVGLIDTIENGDWSDLEKECLKEIEDTLQKM